MSEPGAAPPRGPLTYADYVALPDDGRRYQLVEGELDLYARHGVPHCWVIDVAARSIEENVAAGDVYRVRSVTANDEDFRPVALPGFEFRLATVGLPETPSSAD